MGHKTPSQLQKGPIPMISRLKDVQRSLMYWAAKSWFDGLLPPGYEDAR